MYKFTLVLRSCIPESCMEGTSKNIVNIVNKRTWILKLVFSGTFTLNCHEQETC